MVSSAYPSDHRIIEVHNPYDQLDLEHLVYRSRLYILWGNPAPEDIDSLQEFLCQSSTTDLSATQPDGSLLVDVWIKPGVFDFEAEELLRVAELLGIRLEGVSTGWRYCFSRQVPVDRLYNPLIHECRVHTPSVTKISTGDIPGENERRHLALSCFEVGQLQSYFEPRGYITDVELEMVAVAWSEHCMHKLFKREGLLDKIRATAEGFDWVELPLKDNAGIVRLTKELNLVVKVETHNHPSAIEPFGGAQTGIGGVIRDVLGVGGRPIALLDGLCFAPPDMSPPEGALPPKDIISGVVRGIGDYGNKVGLPTVAGMLVYDEGYVANPLVYCGCIGIMPAGSYRRNPQPGQRLLLLGGRTGRDGIGGVTFASTGLGARRSTVVQMGDPILARGLIEVIDQGRGLYEAVTDLGGGGLSCAVSELCRDHGFKVHLDRVPLKYPLVPWEIWVSESQERMLLAVRPDLVAAVKELCQLYDVEVTDIGALTDTGKATIRYGADIIGQVDLDFLFEGWREHN